MGLRGKIIGLFFIGFGLMSLIAFELLHTRLQEGFVEIERKQAMGKMMQLTHNLNNELRRLDLINTSWASWDAMVEFAQNPTDDFILHQIIPGALQTPGIKFLLILDKQGNTLFSGAFDSATGREESPSSFNTIFTNVKYRINNPDEGKTCGLDISTVGPALVCWQPIQPSNHLGATVGTLVMGQLIDESMLKRIREQSGSTFEISRLPIQLNKNPSIPSATIESEKIEFSKSEPNILTTSLGNLVGQPILKVRLQFSNDVRHQGTKIIREVMRVLLLITILTGLTLLISVHFLVIRRLRTMETELNNIWSKSRWTGRLTIKEHDDEISQLTHSINRMLTLIRKQMLVLELNAHTDALTQIANRRAFDQRLSIEMSVHKRNHTPLSVLILDVDYFKRYNDYYGHPAGDKVLKAVGKVLTHMACRPSDLAARIGGEEFAIILPATDLEGANFLAEKIKQQLENQQIVHADSLVSNYVTISIGVTTAGDEDVAAFLQRADRATYNAKQTGRNRICSLPGTPT